MADKSNVWAILVAEKHADPYALRTSAAVLERDTEHLLARARSVAAADHTCAVIAQAFEEDWKRLAESMPPSNSFVHPTAQPLVRGVQRCLSDLSKRSPNAQIILIPADHCASVEESWIASANNALLLGKAQPDTIYILHDKEQNDPRTSKHGPGVCSSSVIVSFIQPLLELCAGERETTFVDLLVDDSKEVSPTLTSSTERRPLKVIHVTSIEEYARLQRGSYGRPASRIDVHA